MHNNVYGIKDEQARRIGCEGRLQIVSYHQIVWNPLEGHLIGIPILNSSPLSSNQAKSKAQNQRQPKQSIFKK